MNKRITISIVLLLASIFIFRANYRMLAQDDISTHLKGRILLEVERHGEAWYVNPTDRKRHYLGRPDDAFRIMRTLGLGVSNNDLQNIPLADDFAGTDTDGDGLPDAVEDSLGTDKVKTDTDGDGHDDKTEVMSGYHPVGTGNYALSAPSSTIKGVILIQVEKHGEAWYIDPTDGRRHFLGRPADAFRVMRQLGLGISGRDLAMIDEYAIPQTYKGEDIVKKFTALVTDQPSQRSYRDPEGAFSVEYPNGWSIRKYDDIPELTQITDSLRDFMVEKKAVITMSLIRSEAPIAKVSAFRAAIKGNSATLSDKDLKVNELDAYENSYSHELAYEKTTVVKLDDQRFLQITLTTPKAQEARYVPIYDALLASLKK